MEIDITRFVTESDPYEFSASQHEMGGSAGEITWNNAKQAGADSPLLETEEQLQALRDHVAGYGAWDSDEIAAWSDSECNALFIQIISGDMRESGMDSCDMAEFDWAEYEKDSNAGEIPGNIFRGDTGLIYYYLGT